MYVRAVSNIDRGIFPSMVYARINQGWYAKYVVYNEWKKVFELVDYMDKVVDDKRNVRIFMIQTDTDGFEEYGNAKLLKLKKYCSDNGREMPDVKTMFGYPDVCGNCAFICDIMEDRQVPADRYDIALRDLPDVNEWHYLRTPEEVEEFMKLFAGFHDSDLVKVTYEESGDGSKTAYAVFDNSGWFGIAELCFEGVQYLRIVPAGESYMSEILSATLEVNDDGVFWADTYMEKPDMSYEGSIIRSLSLKWRKLGTTE